LSSVKGNSTAMTNEAINNLTNSFIRFLLAD
jgi:hypothetical protein